MLSINPVAVQEVSIIVGYIFFVIASASAGFIVIQRLLTLPDIIQEGYKSHKLQDLALDKDDNKISNMFKDKGGFKL